MFGRKSKSKTVEVAPEPVPGNLFDKQRGALDEQIELIAAAGAADEAHGAIFDGLVDAWLTQELAAADAQTRRDSLDCERRTLDAQARVQKLRTQLTEAEAWLNTPSNRPAGVDPVAVSGGPAHV